MEANREAAALLAEKGDKALRQHDYKEAVRFFERSSKLFPSTDITDNLAKAVALEKTQPTAPREETTSDAPTSSARTTTTSSAGTPASPGEAGGSPAATETQGVRHRKGGGAPDRSSETDSKPTSTKGAEGPGEKTSKRVKPRPPEEASGPPPRTYTKEQESLVMRVVRSTNHYEALGVSKTAKEEEIKKCYKKLALMLHPDKNGHPRAEEAFKAVSQAFQIVTDSDKRHMYDKYGTDAPQATRVHPTEFMTPEDLFNHIFFGGGLLRPHAGYSRRVRVQSTHGNTAQQEAEAQPRFMLLIMMLAVMTIMSLFMNTSQQRRTWDYHKSSEFTLPRETANYKIKYFVSPEFDAAHPTGDRNRPSPLGDLEDHIERNVLRSNCDQEYQELHRKVHYMRMQKGKNSKEVEAKIAELKEKGTPSCDRYKQLAARARRR